MTLRIPKTFLFFLLAPALAWSQPSVTVTAIDSDASELGTDPATFQFTRTGDTSSELAVRFVAEGDTAGLDSDWSADPAPTFGGFDTAYVTIPAAQTSLLVTITPLIDNLAEGDETLTLRVVSFSNDNYLVGTPDQASITIADDAPVISVSTLDDSASELGDTGQLTFSRTGGDSSQALPVRFFVEGDTAGLDNDWSADPMPTFGGFDSFYVTIPASQTSQTLTITPLIDNLAEGDETLTLRVVSFSNDGYLVGSPDQGSVTIADSAPIVTVTATDREASESGDPGQFEFGRTGGDLSQALTVRFMAEGTASDLGTDWQADPALSFGGFGSLLVTIPADETSTAVTVTPLLDADETEGNETLTFRITPFSNDGFLVGQPGEDSITIADFVDLILTDSFEAAIFASLLTKRCAADQLAAMDPARFHDGGTTIVDLDEQVMYLRCAVSQSFDWPSDACVDAVWAEDSGIVAPRKVLEHFNAGLLGDNAGHADWRWNTDSGSDYLTFSCLTRATTD